MAAPKKKDSKPNLEPTTAFIHGRREVKGKGDNKDNTTSVKYDKVLGNLAKLDIRVVILYAEPQILDNDIAAFKVEVTPVTQEEFDKALTKVFAS